MENTIEFFPHASWAVVNGAFTADELREIAKQIDNPELRKESKDGKKN